MCCPGTGNQLFYLPSTQATHVTYTDHTKPRQLFFSVWLLSGSKTLYKVSANEIFYEGKPGNSWKKVLNDPVTWYKISHAGEQVAQWDFSKTVQLVPVHLDLPLFWKSHCATCSPACVILYHVTGSCKGPIILRARVFFERMVNEA